MEISKETAKRALAFLERGDTFGQAAHDCEVTLTSIAPYTDRSTERVLRLFRWLDSRPLEKRETDLATLRHIAG